MFHAEVVIVVSATESALELARQALAKPEADLVEQERRLSGQLQRTQLELAEVRLALARIRQLATPGAPARAAAPVTPRSPTMDALNAYVRSLPPGSRIQGGPAAEWALAHGWQTTATNPVGAMQCQITRAADLGILYRESHGRIFTWTEPAAVAS